MKKPNTLTIGPIKGLLILIILLTGFYSKAQFRADFSSGVQSGCSPLVVNFKDSSTGNPTSWIWDLGNGTTSVLQNPSVAYFDPGDYTVKLKIKNALGTDSVVKVQYITVYASPTVNFNASSLTGCFPLLTQFEDLSFPGSGTVQKWEWDFGDGNFSNQQKPSHIYTGLGNFNVSLRVTNNFGCVTNKTIPSYIRINSGVKAEFANSGFKSCNAPATVSFENKSTGTGSLSYQWNFGDGASSSLANPSHTYDAPGSYTVSLLATNSTGCTDTIIKPHLVVIGSVNANFTAPNPVCLGTPFTFKNTSAPTPSASRWDFGDGTFSDSINPSKIYTKEGIYTIKLVADFGACKDSIKKSVQVVAKPIVTFSADNMVACKAPFNVNFQNTTAAGASYLWNFGDGTTSTNENPSHTYSKEGTFTVKLFVTNISGCMDSLVKKDFIKISKPSVSINNLPQKGCVPLAHTFSAKINSLDALTGYLWNFGDGTTSTEVSPKHVYTTPGKFSVTLTYTTAGGCTDSVKVVNGILAGLKPKAAFIIDPVNACADKNISFTDQTIGTPNEWQWFFGDGSGSASQNPIHQYDDTGYFPITLIALDNGCADTMVIKKAVHINPPVAAFTPTKNCVDRGSVTFTDHSLGADTWTWNFGDGAVSSEKSPIHNYTASGVYSVSLTVTNNESGCSKTKTQTVRVILDKANFISSNATICRNLPVTFTASNSSPANISLYTWSFGDGTSVSDSGNTISHAYTKSSAYDVTLIIKDANGCLDSIKKPLAVRVDGPTASFRSAQAGTCLNQEVSFSDSSFSDGTHALQEWKFNWGDGNSQTFTAAPFNHTYSGPGNYTVSLQVKDSKGCIDSISKPKEIIVSKPLAIFSADSLSCTTKSVTFNNTSSGPGLKYTWDFGDGTSSNAQNPVHLYGNEGSYSVALSIKDIYGCMSQVSKTNYVKIANPEADFLLSDSVGTCPPLVVNFTNRSKNYLTWHWDFGDGNTSSLANPSHFYASVGTFHVVLTVTGATGCTSQKTKQIKVNGPTGTFTYSNLVGCTPLKTSFKAHTGKNISFVWDFNDGTTISSKDSAAQHVYTSQGKYLPKMILEDATGCKVPIFGKDSIQVFGVIASFERTAGLLCDSGTAKFNNTSINNDLIVNYLWNFGDGKTSTQQDPSHQYTQPGTYKTSLSVITQRGCKDTAGDPSGLRIHSSPKAAIAGDPGACVPATINFKGVISKPDTSIVSWKWDFANGHASTQQDPVAQTYATSGKFDVKAIVSSNSGCKTTVIKSVDIYPLPVLVTSDDVVCVGSSTTLKVSGAKTYAWSPATYLSCANCATPVSKADSSIKYFVKGTSEKGCVSKDSVHVTVKFPFKLKISKEDSLCLGRSIELNASGTEKYNWTPATGLNNPSISSPVASPTTSITYRVIGQDSKGCFKDTGYIPISVFPVPTVNAGGDKTINVGQQTEIIPVISKDVIDIMWTPRLGIVADKSPGIVVQPTESLEYTIDVKNSGGCRARDKISVFVLCNNANVFVPNTFSPNGDGANDIFYPRGSGVFKIKTFRIFNRWGEIVFERANFNANTASAGWDGTYKGKQLSSDVFVYTLEVVCDNNTSLVFKGNIALVR